MQNIKKLAALALACLLVLTTGYSGVFAASVSDNTYDKKEEAQVLVNYLVVEEPVVETPGTQSVMLGIGDGSMEIESAVLSYRNQATDEVYETKATEILGDFVLFQMEYQDESQTGSYQMERIAYTVEGNTLSVSFSEMGIDALFGVNQVTDSEPDDILLTEEEAEAFAAETEMSIVSLDEEGNPLSGKTMEQALEDAGCNALDGSSVMMMKGAGSVDATGMSSVKVVLDAGHGGSDPGAQANGIVEKTVNLKIAQYCKAELEEYAGVIVYMTRTDDTYLSLAQRAQVAIDKKADVFVSLHNNSNNSSVPNGANVYYPNSSYNPNCGSIGQSLATIIESKLTDLGLASGGIHIRDSENGTKYPDGSLADYYGVIKRCKENGIPALIVEHAFISNASDAKNYLSTDAQLKKLGIADATGIAEYYGLKKGLGFNSIESFNSTTMDLSWSAVKGVTGYCIYRSTSSGDGFKEVAQISSASTTTWKDTGLSPGTTYYYKIRTYTKSDSGTKYGTYSAVASGTTMVKLAISSIKSKDSKTLVISWETVNDAANYEIYRAKKKNGTYSKIATVAGVNRVSYTDSNLKAGKLYYYKIRSVGQVGNTTVYSDYSEIVPARTAKIPTNIFVKSQASDTLRVSWTGDANAAGYVIKRASSAKGKYQKVGTVSSGTKNYYDDNTVQDNTTYYYKVQSFNYNNNTRGVSGFSGAASGKTIKKTAITKIVSTGPKKQTISWKKVAGVDGYIIYQSTSKNGKYTKIQTIKSPNTTSLKVTKLKAGTRYYYKVRTRKKVNGKVGYGSYSTTRNAWTVTEPVITSVQGSTGNSIQISWNPVGGATGYNIYRADALDGSYSKIASAAGTESGYTDSNLDMTKQYYYKIEVSMQGFKAESASATGAAVGGSPINSTSITSASGNAQGLLEIKWNAVKDITGYQIYRSMEQNGSFTLLQTISDSTATSYVDTSAVSGVGYYYKIVLIGQYNNQTIYGPESSAVPGMLQALP